MSLQVQKKLNAAHQAALQPSNTNVFCAEAAGSSSAAAGDGAVPAIAQHQAVAAVATAATADAEPSTAVPPPYTQLRPYAQW